MVTYSEQVSVAMLFSNGPETFPLKNRVGAIRASERGARHFLDHATSGHQKEHRESSHEDTPFDVHSLGQLLHDASLSPSGLVRSCCAGTVGRPGRSILKKEISSNRTGSRPTADPPASVPRVDNPGTPYRSSLSAGAQLRSSSRVVGRRIRSLQTPGFRLIQQRPEC